MLILMQFILVGLFAGTLSGLLGIGGAVLIIPALVYLFGFGQKIAQGTTLLLMIPPIGILAALEYYKRGEVNLKAGVFIASGFIIGGLIGGKLVGYIPVDLLKKIFALVLVVIAIRMWFK